MREIKKIIVHCSATRPSMDVGAREIRDWHTKNNGWSDIGYHGVIRRDGTFEPGRSFDTPGAHTSGQNKNSVGICLVGGVGGDNKTPENNFTPAQFETLERTVRELLQKFPEATVHGHNEFAAKACPSFNVREWWESV